MGGAERGQTPAGLSPGGGGGTVSMNNAAKLLKGAVKLEVRGRVGTGPQLAFNDSPRVERHHSDVLGFEILVGNSGRFDCDQSALAVDGTGIAPGVNDQTLFNEVEIGFTNCLLQLPQAHGSAITNNE